MTRLVHTVISLLAVLGVSSHAAAQPAGALAIRTEGAPWGNPIVLAVCDAGTLVISDAHVDDYGEVVDYRIYSSTDGSRWQREALDDEIMLLGAQCIDGVTWAYGHPGIIARRDARGRWTVEHSGPENLDWNRRSVVSGLTYDRATSTLRAWGIDGGGEPFELARASDGTWSSVPRSRRPSRPPVQPPECRSTPRRPPPLHGATFARAMMCRGGRLVVWTNGQARRPDAVIRLPQPMRRERWSVLGASDDAIYLFAPVRQVIDGVVIDETTQHVLARYRAGAWASVTIEARVVAPALLRMGGAPFAVGTGHVFRFEDPS